MTVQGCYDRLWKLKQIGVEVCELLEVPYEISLSISQELWDIKPNPKEKNFPFPVKIIDFTSLSVSRVLKESPISSTMGSFSALTFPLRKVIVAIPISFVARTKLMAVSPVSQSPKTCNWITCSGYEILQGQVAGFMFKYFHEWGLFLRAAQNLAH